MNTDEPPFKFVPDEARGITTIRLVGFWDRATSDAFRAALAENANRARRTMRNIAVLVDLRDFDVQGQDVLGSLRGSAEARLSHRTAILVPPSTLQRMQVQRVANPSDDRRFFDSEAEALAWLQAGV